MAIMRDELYSTAVNQVQELVDLLCDCKPIGNKWVLKVKSGVDGFITKQGTSYDKSYTQRKCIDYEETFSFASIRLL